MTALAWLVLVAWPLPALAHTKGGEALGFSSGVQHPMSGLDHVLAMLAVGVWGAQLGAPAVWLLPVTFPMVMAFGGMLALMGMPLPGIEIGIAVSAIALGYMVCREARPPVWVATVLVWGSSRFFMGTRTARNCWRVRTVCCTVSALCWAPAACMRWALRLGCCTDGGQDNWHYGLPGQQWLARAGCFCGERCGDMVTTLVDTGAARNQWC